MDKFFSFLAHKYFLWGLIAILAFFPILQLSNYPLSAREFKEVMHESGETAIRLMLVAMVVSPLRLIFPTNGFVLWMARNRRYFGVGAFCLALIHFVAYVLDEKLMGVINELNQPRILAGWLAFIIFIPLAATSTNWAVRKLGSANWKRLHQTIYVACLAAALHWLLLKDGEGIVPALIHFLPLLLLESYRFLYLRRKKIEANT